MKSILFISIILFTFTSCGDDSKKDELKITDSIAYLVDSRVNGIKYYCNEDFIGYTGDASKEDGSFKVQYKCNYIKFMLGNITLGEIKPNDIRENRLVFINEILGLDVFDTNNSNLFNILRVLQTLDENENLKDGINIPKSISPQACYTF